MSTEFDPFTLEGVTPKYYRGIKGVSFIWHGAWNDPELEIKQGCFKCRANYWDIDDSMWEYFKENTKKGERTEENFNKFCYENKKSIIADIKECGKWTVKN